MTVAVNLSMVNLLDLDLVDTIDRLLTAHRVRARGADPRDHREHIRQRLVAVPQDRVSPCGASGSGSRSTTTARDGRRWPACRICRSTN